MSFIYAWFIVSIFILSKVDDTDISVLIRKVKLGDHRAFQDLFNRYHQMLYRYLVGKKVREEVAQDIVQQAFIWVWENRTSLDPDKSLKAYLFRIAYTRFLNTIRDAKKFKDEENEMLTVESGDQADDQIINAELKKKIEHAINQLPDKRRQVFELCYLEEFTYKEAAQTLECSVKTIENHMGLALKQLRELLS